MARLFDRDAPDRLDNSSTPAVTGPPFTVVAWIRPAIISGGQTILTLADSGENGDRYILQLHGTGSIRWYAIDSGNNVRAESSTTLAVDTWGLAIGREVAANDRDALLNGGGEGSNAVSVTPVGLDKTSIGIDGKLTPVAGFEGDIGHVGFWNKALSNAQLLSLAAGLNFKQMEPGSLVFYPPINGRSPETDIIGGRNLIVTGTTVSEEPPNIRRSMVAPG